MLSDKYNPEEEEGSYEKALSEVVYHQHPGNVDIQGQYLYWSCTGREGGREGGRREKKGGKGGREGGWRKKDLLREYT